MKFRDREETIEAGEFIVVPLGVEHCAVAVGGQACEVLTATTSAPGFCPAAGSNFAHSGQSRSTAQGN
jgi:quercetin dioxygenase-like cupin family protein